MRGPNYQILYVNFLVAFVTFVCTLLFYPHADNGNLGCFSAPTEWNLHDDRLTGINASIANSLKGKVRIFCWIMTSPKNHLSKAIHVKATWAQRCNGYVFMSSQRDDSLPSVALEVSEGYDHLWAKTRAAFRYVYDNHLQEFDFFLKADDDTYVVVENLRYMLRNDNPDTPVYYGRHFKPYVNQGYMSGGAGYVLSREAVKRFVNLGINQHPGCRASMNYRLEMEDVNMGLCLEAVNVHTGDSRDEMGRERFHPFPLEYHLIPGHIEEDNWLWSYSYHPLSIGPNCCSDTTVSFHYVSPPWMYALDSLLYHVHPFGVTPDYRRMQQYLQDSGVSLKTQQKKHQMDIWKAWKNIS